jgi:tetratricopeptide (TPR) repeat protein
VCNARSKTSGIVLCSLLWTQGVLAQERAPAQVSDPCLSDEACSTLYQRGRARSQAGHLEAALDNYQAALRRRPVPWLLVSVGRMQQKLGHLAEAMTTYRRVLNDPVAAADAEALARARSYLRQAEEEVRRGSARAAPAPASPPGRAPLPPGIMPGIARTADGPPGRGRRIAGLTIGALGIGVAAAGITFGVLAQRASDALSDTSAHGGAFDPGVYAAGRTYQIVEGVTLGVSAAALVTGAVLYALGRREGRPLHALGGRP